MTRSTLVCLAALVTGVAVSACSDTAQPTAPEHVRAGAVAEPQVAAMTVKGKPKFVIARTTVNLSPSDDVFTSVTAICPEGAVATGGGYYGFPGILVASSYPLTADDELPLEGEAATRWEVRARNEPGGGFRQVSVFAVCSN